MQVQVADGSYMEAKGEGTLRITTEDRSYTFPHTMFIPYCDHNILSVSALTDKGITVTFHKSHAFVYKTESDSVEVMLTAYKCNGLFVIDINKCSISIPSSSYDAFDVFNKHRHEI